MFAVDVAISVCFDKDECVISQIIFDGVQFPKPLCNYNTPLGKWKLMKYYAKHLELRCLTEKNI